MRTPTSKVIRLHQSLKRQQRADSVRATAKPQYCISLDSAISPQQILFGLATPKIGAIAQALHEASRQKTDENGKEEVR